MNFIDTYQRSGLYPIAMPAVLGLEAAGIVEAIGEGVTRFAIGDRAAYGNGPVGAYSQAHCVPERPTRPCMCRPACRWRRRQPAMLKGMTAENSCCGGVFAVIAGQTILVHAAAGGVGQILVQWGNRALAAQ